MTEGKNLSHSKLGRSVVELTLIVFGVLAALALQGWWEDKVEERNLIEYLEALVQEVQQNQDLLKREAFLSRFCDRARGQGGQEQYKSSRKAGFRHPVHQ